MKTDTIEQDGVSFILARDDQRAVLSMMTSDTTCCIIGRRGGPATAANVPDMWEGSYLLIVNSRLGNYTLSEIIYTDEDPGTPMSSLMRGFERASRIFPKHVWDFGQTRLEQLRGPGEGPW